MNDAPHTHDAGPPADPSAETPPDQAPPGPGPAPADDDGRAAEAADSADANGPDAGAAEDAPDADATQGARDDAGDAKDDRSDGEAGGAKNGGGDSGGADETPPRQQGKSAKRERPTLVVRYGRMRLLGRFRYALDRWRRGQRAVVKSERGIEIGTIICRWVEDGGDAGDLKVKGEVLRLVTHADEVDERHLEKDAQREFAFCKQCIAAHNLPMKLAAVEHLFGGDRIIFYFVAEKRVDFRALVRDLAREFQTRIEMRQIGVRDEARLLGDYERCGRPLCCRAFIKDLEPVSMKMAKVQKATLDPAKISGRCGRLMCCLRFEHATYRELQKTLPRKNKEVGTAVGPGTVVDTDVVTQTVSVMLASGTRVVVPVETLMAPEEAPAPAAVAPVVEGRGRGPKKDGGADRDNGGDGGGAAPSKGSGPEKDAGASSRGRRKRRRSKGKRRGQSASKAQNAKSGGGGTVGKKSNHGNAKG